MTRLSPQELLRRGGAWLGAARTWLQNERHNGATARWGSDEQLRPPMTMRDAEELAAHAAAAALAEAAADVERLTKERDEARKELADVHAATEDGVQSMLHSRDREPPTMRGTLAHRIWLLAYDECAKGCDLDAARAAGEEVQAALAASEAECERLTKERDEAAARAHRVEQTAVRDLHARELERTPPGTRLCYFSGDEVIVLGWPEPDDENHNCDAMGCATFSHVIERHRVARAAT